MEPAFFDGNHVLTFNWIKPKVEDAVVFRSDDENLIKRVKKIKDGKIFVEGDNRKFSSKIDPAEPAQIIGKVILKY